MSSPSKQSEEGEPQRISAPNVDGVPELHFARLRLSGKTRIWCELSH
jgi:hypothetical protein